MAKLIENNANAIFPAPERIIYCAKFKTSVPATISHLVEFNEGLPTTEHLENPNNERLLIVIDDLQDEAFASPEIVTAFQSSRHRNVSLIVLTQNLFPRSKRSRDISLNCDIIVIFYSARDQSSVWPLSRQLCGERGSAMADIFFKYINAPYKYLFIDLTPSNDPLLRYRTNIFNPEVEVFTPESVLKDFLNDGANKEERAFDYKFSTIQ